MASFTYRSRVLRARKTHDVFLNINAKEKAKCMQSSSSRFTPAKRRKRHYFVVIFRQKNLKQSKEGLLVMKHIVWLNLFVLIQNFILPL